MITVKTRDFGELEINPDDVFIFPNGIPAFEHLRKFVLIEHQQESPFRFLQSVEEGDLSFVVADPVSFFPKYSVEVGKKDLGDIGIEREEEARIMVIITVSDEPKNMTANLQAPLILNAKRKLGKQLILSTSNYNTRHRLFSEEELKACE